MFFRFVAALLLVVLVSMAGIRLEKQTLELRRAVSVQHYQCDELVDIVVQLRLRSQQLLSPVRTGLGSRSESSEARTGGPVNEFVRDSRGERVAGRHQTPLPDAPHRGRLPLMQFPAPFDPRGID